MVQLEALVRPPFSQAVSEGAASSAMYQERSFALFLCRRSCSKKGTHTKAVISHHVDVCCECVVGGSRRLEIVGRTRLDTSRLVEHLPIA